MTTLRQFLQDNFPEEFTPPFEGETAKEKAIRLLRYTKEIRGNLARSALINTVLRHQLMISRDALESALARTTEEDSRAELESVLAATTDEALKSYINEYLAGAK